MTAIAIRGASQFGTRATVTELLTQVAMILGGMILGAIGTLLAQWWFQKTAEEAEEAEEADDCFDDPVADIVLRRRRDSHLRESGDSGQQLQHETLYRSQTGTHYHNVKICGGVRMKSLKPCTKCWPGLQ